MFEELFEQIVRRCVEVGLVRASTCRWMAVSYRRMPRRRAAFRASSYASRFFNELPGAVVVQFENILTGSCSLHCA